MKTTEIYNKFYTLLYEGIIDENAISLAVAEACVKERHDEFIKLCNELQDVLISDREWIAFYLTMKFIEA